VDITANHPSASQETRLSAGQTQGVHLMAAYLPQQGVVLAQVQVASHTNEITAAPTLLKALDLRAVVVTGDAMHAQRDLSVQIVEADGDYLWTVKDNQPDLREEIATLFAPTTPLPATSTPAMDLRTARTTEKGHGRLEVRTLTASSDLAGYSTWPHVAQVFRLESRTTDALGQIRTDIRYGITSLPAHVADAARLLELTCGQWGIENGLHYRQDVTFQEDRSQLRMGRAPEVLAALNNTAIGLFLLRHHHNVAQARRSFAYHFDRALATLAA